MLCVGSKQPLRRWNQDADPEDANGLETRTSRSSWGLTADLTTVCQISSN